MYESLLKEACKHDINVYEEPMEKKVKGLYGDNVIWINRNINTSIEKACVLAEELGHYHTSVGDIIDQSKIINIKQEKIARRWAYKKLVPLNNLLEAFKGGCRSRFEIAEFLNITEVFLDDSLSFYREKYGTEIQIDKTYTLLLDPLGVYKNFYP